MAKCDVCLSLALADLESLRRRLAAVRDADFVEVRLDALADPTALGASQLQALLSVSVVPLIITCRPTWEGGGYAGDEAPRQRLVERALEAGAAFVDVELAAEWGAELLPRWRHRMILSHHWESSGLEGLDDVVGQLLRLRPAIGKLVAPVQTPDAALPLLAAAERLRGAGIGSACFAMGEQGAASRLLSAARGDRLIYAAGPSSAPTAPGQWQASYLVDELRLGRWRPEHGIYALAGDPIEHSLSPAIFNAAFAGSDTDAVYSPFAGKPFESILALAVACDVRGMSITMPFKQQALRVCETVAPLAQRIGAVNTLVRCSDQWHGHNTDGPAVVAALETRTRVHGARCAVIGAGGAARAAVVSLLDAGAEVVVLNRTAMRGEAVAEQLGCAAAPLEKLQAETFDVLVNATPVGMNGTTRSVVSTAWLKGDETILDMVYRPLETPLLRRSRQRGCRTVSGLEMFLRQAALQFELWTGLDAPVQIMREVAQARLAAEPEPAA